MRRTLVAQQLYLTAVSCSLRNAATAQNFFNPISKNFTIPSGGGISYSFVEDLADGGHFETSSFTYTSNGE